MKEPTIPDKAHRPTDADLASVLGRAKRHWDGFIACIQRNHPAATAEWKHYSTGWQFVLREKRRNLAYLKPSEKCFTVSFAFSDNAVDAAERSDLPAEIVQPIRQSPKYPEGRAVRVDVATAKDLAIATKLLAIKVSH